MLGTSYHVITKYIGNQDKYKNLGETRNISAPRLQSAHNTCIFSMKIWCKGSVFATYIWLILQWFHWDMLATVSMVIIEQSYEHMHWYCAFPSPMNRMDICVYKNGKYIDFLGTGL